MSVGVSEDCRSAWKVNPKEHFSNGVSLSSIPLKGLCEFEVKLTKYGGTCWSGNLKVGIMSLEAGDVIYTPRYTPGDISCRVWSTNCLYEFGSKSKEYGEGDLDDVLRAKDTIGFQITREGDLSFFLNGRCQGVAFTGVYSNRKKDVYAVVDHYGQAVSTEIVRAGR